MGMSEFPILGYSPIKETKTLNQNKATKIIVIVQSRLQFENRTSGSKGTREKRA